MAEWRDSMAERQAWRGAMDGTGMGTYHRGHVA